MRKSFLKIACVFVGALFTLFGIVQLSQGNMGWKEVIDPDSIDGTTNIPFTLVALVLGPSFIYFGITGRGFENDD